MPQTALSVLLLMAVLCFPVVGEEAQLDPRLRAVQDYLLNGDDYPELFGDKPYRMKIQGFAIGDLDGDTMDEVVLLTKPHYRQSPPISIFRVDKDLKVTRVVEGLAPGPLAPVTGDYLDSHTLGEAVDFEVIFDGDPVAMDDDIVSKMLEQFGGVVRYKDWFHADNRAGRKMYIDMSHAQVPQGQGHCEDFEFSPVDAVNIMHRNDGAGNYLLAIVGENIYAYKIHRFLENGLMNKSVEVFPLPKE